MEDEEIYRTNHARIGSAGKEEVDDRKSRVEVRYIVSKVA